MIFWIFPAGILQPVTGTNLGTWEGMTTENSSEYRQGLDKVWKEEILE